MSRLQGKVSQVCCVPDDGNDVAGGELEDEEGDNIELLDQIYVPGGCRQWL